MDECRTTILTRQPSWEPEDGMRWRDGTSLALGKLTLHLGASAQTQSDGKRCCECLTMRTKPLECWRSGPGQVGGGWC